MIVGCKLQAIENASNNLFFLTSRGKKEGMAPHSQSSSDEIYSVPVPDDETDDSKRQLSSSLSRVALRRQELQLRRRNMPSGTLLARAAQSLEAERSIKSPWRRPGSQLRAKLLEQDEKLTVPEKLPMARCLRVSERVRACVCCRSSLSLYVSLTFLPPCRFWISSCNILWKHTNKSNTRTWWEPDLRRF